MKESFRDNVGLNKANTIRLGVVNGILEEYRKQGYKLTLRQLYYQLVSRAIIPNRKQEYAKLSGLLVKGRMSGVVDWDAIEDRLRVPFLPYWVSGVSDAIDDTVNQYRLNRQRNQDNYIELWVEKDALSGVLKRITSYYHINLMVNRGYSSCSAMHDAFERFEKQNKEDENLFILYLGDHDPSGLDMINDIEKRLNEFGVNPEVKHLALTMKQIEKYKPPPNPAKITDPRAKQYIAEHGNVSWEVDALNPTVLHAIVKKSVEKLIDMDLFTEQLTKETIDKEKLRDFGNEYEEAEEDE